MLLVDDCIGVIVDTKLYGRHGSSLDLPISGFRIEGTISGRLVRVTFADGSMHCEDLPEPGDVPSSPGVVLHLERGQVLGPLDVDAPAETLLRLFRTCSSISHLEVRMEDGSAIEPLGSADPPDPRRWTGAW